MNWSYSGQQADFSFLAKMERDREIARSEGYGKDLTAAKKAVGAEK